MSRNSREVEWLKVLNEQPKIIFFSARIFYCILAAAIISLIVLKPIAALSQRNFLSLWLLISTFSLTLTRDGCDDLLRRWKSLRSRKKDWIDLDSEWQPLNPSNKNKNYKTIDGFEGIPFQNYSDLDTILEISSGKTKFTAIFCRDPKGHFHARIPFTIVGLHPDCSDETVIANLNIIREAFNDYPKDENLELVMGARSRCDNSDLKSQAFSSIPPLIKAIDLNQADRDLLLTKSRLRQEWHHLAFCSWHDRSANKYLANSDFWGFLAALVESALNYCNNLLRGKNSTAKAKYSSFAKLIYRDGFQKWQNFFALAQLKVKPLSECH